MRKAGFIISIFLVSFLITQSGDPLQLDHIYLKYDEANKLFHSKEPTDETDSVARVYFDEIITACNNEKGIQDSVFFNALWKRGVLSEITEEYTAAIDFYQRALQLAGSSHTLEDSVRFEPLVYAGGIYYRESKFDSAKNMLEQARQLEEQFIMPREAERLYNTLGALYFESGNYLQSKNCFEKALHLIEKSKGNEIQKVDFQNNIATALNRLGQHHEALNRYLKLLQYENLAKDLSLNIGNAYMSIKDYRQALFYFHKSRTGTAGKQVLNHIAKAHLQLNNYDSASYYLDMFEAGIAENSSAVSKVTLGTHYIYKGDYHSSLSQNEEAANAYQKAITLLLYQYDDASAYSNPGSFSGTLSSFNLFNAIIKKGDCFEKLYNQFNKPEYLRASVNAYNAATHLADYLEETMDTDEARIFLKQNSNTAYKKFIDLNIQLYGIQAADSLIRNAYEAVGRNKASVLMANLKEFSIKNKMNVPAELLQQERDLKYNIARLQIKMDQEAGTDMEAMMVAKRNFELKLSGLQSKIKQYTGGPGNEESTITAYSGNKNQAVLDFYFSNTHLYVFMMADKQIKHVSIPVSHVPLANIAKLQKALQHKEFGDGKTTESIANQAFTDYIQPFWPVLKDRKEWIIIPDGIFYYLPFEVLINPANSRMLIEDFTISYQVNTQFIAKNNARNNEKPSASVLAVAPFTKRTLYSYADSIRLDPLPATATEVADLKGTILLDTAATKSSFLAHCNQYNVLHLATHAIMNPGKPSQSYIVFYPTDSTKPESYKLYLNELYSLNLDSTRLMLLSACETGVGQIVENEGVMSLSRGVLYAGCPSVITTLWPAADKSTAYIIKKFYSFLEEGMSMNNALRMAKLDFVKTHPHQMHPSFWAHLTLVGAIEPLHETAFKFNLPISATGIGLIIVSVLIMVRRKKARKNA